MNFHWCNLLDESANMVEGDKDQKIYFIAHSFDQVLVGYIEDEQDYPLLRAASEENKLLELHLFNHIKEIYAVWENNQVVRYADLMHEDKDYTEHFYELEARYGDNEKLIKKRNPAFDTLVTRTYWERSGEDYSYMPRIKKTVLYALKRGGSEDEQSAGKS